MTTDPFHAHVQCDTCNGAHMLEVPRDTGTNALEAANAFLVAQGWELHEDRRHSSVTRHRCVACVNLRNALAEVAQKYAKLDALLGMQRMQDGHS